MAKLPIDLRHFKKTSEDKNTTTLQHKDGHTITLAHSALSKDMQLALGKLGMAYDGNDKKEQQGDMPNEKMAKGGKVQSNPKLEESKKLPSKPKMYAEGGMTSASEESQSNAQQAAEDAKEATYQDKIESRNGYERSPQENAQPPVTVNVAPNAVQQSPQPAPPPAPGVPEATPNAQMNAEASQQAAAPEQQPAPPTNDPRLQPDENSPAAANLDTSTNPNNYVDTFNSGASQALEGVKNEALAQGQLGKQQALDYQHYIKGQNDAVSEFQKHYQAIDDENQAMMQDINNKHIDPNHFLASKGTAGHIGVGIGLLLGGMSAGTLGGENPAVSMLNRQIDRDIDAQKIELGKKESLLSANFHRYNNMRDATDMTRIMQTNILANKIAMEAAKSQSPMAAANAQKAIGQLKMQIAPQQAQFAMRQMMMNGSGGAPGSEADYTGKLHAMQMLAPDLYKDYQAKYIPGEGVAEAIPTPDDKKAIEKFNTLGQRLNEAVAFQQKMGSTGAWTPENRAIAKNLQDSIVVQMNDLTGLNRLNHEEYANYTSQVGKIGSVNAGGTLAGLKDLQHQLDQHKQTLLKSLNVKPFAKSNQNQVALQWARSNPSDPRAAEILKRLGVK